MDIHANTESKSKGDALGDFDNFAEGYDATQKKTLGLFARKKDITTIFADYKLKETRRLIGNEPRTILDFGCGIGRNIAPIIKYFPAAKIFGCDISSESLKIAESSHPSCAFFLSDSPKALTVYAQKFDLVIMTCVLHHIPPVDRVTWLAAIAQTLSPSGAFITFEHNPYNPMTRLMVKRCEFDQHAELLTAGECWELLAESGLSPYRKGYSLLFPWRTQTLEAIEHLLAPVPFGKQYYIAADGRGKGAN